MHKFALFIFTGFFAASCTTPKAESALKDSLSLNEKTKGDSVNGFNENNYESYLRLENYLSTSISGEIQTIDSTCAIVVDPTEDQIKKMEIEYGDDFPTIADDNSYFLSEAYLRLDSSHIKTVNANKRFLKLVGKSQTWILDIRKEGAPEWNMIFFHKDKTPEILSSLDATYDKIEDYFEK